MQTANLVGAITAVIIFILVIAVFIARLCEKPDVEYRIGILLFVTAIPLVYLLMVAPSFARSLLYYVQIGLMLLYLIVEYVLDYALKLDFRKTQWAVIAYVMIFFAGAGGMVGVASQAGPPWTAAAGTLFHVMAGLSFYQRVKTGM